MALLLLAHHVQGHHAIFALTVDHGLRTSSTAEARKVKNWCKAMGVVHHTLKWQHKTVTSGLQAKARDARYNLMTTWCKKHGVNNLLTAHTADDQAETVAMRMKRTSSPASLAGIWPETQWNGIRILRPLLLKRRKALRDYLNACGQKWIEDESNTNETYERVRVRNAKPNIGLAKVASHAQHVVASSKRQAKNWASTNCVMTQSGMLQFAPASLKRLSPIACDEALQKIIKLCGGTATELAKRQELLIWFESQSSPRRTLGRVVFVRTKHIICAAKEAARIDAMPQAVTSNAPVLWDKRFLITAPKGSSVVAKCYVNNMKRNDKIPYFVDQSLPIVQLSNHISIDAVQSLSAHVSATFIKK